MDLLRRQAVMRAAGALRTAGGIVFSAQVLKMPCGCTLREALAALGEPLPYNCQELMKTCGMHDSSIEELMEVVVLAKTMQFLASHAPRSPDSVRVDGSTLLTYLACEGYFLATLELLEAGGSGREALKRVTETCTACCRETDVFSCPHASMRALLCWP
jgi:hypothetical protein